MPLFLVRVAYALFPARPYPHPRRPRPRPRLTHHCASTRALSPSSAANNCKHCKQPGDKPNPSCPAGDRHGKASAEAGAHERDRHTLALAAPRLPSPALACFRPPSPSPPIALHDIALLIPSCLSLLPPYRRFTRQCCFDVRTRQGHCALSPMPGAQGGFRDAHNVWLRSRAGSAFRLAAQVQPS